VRCKTCHYSLMNLTEHRCPECGKPFDPNDQSTFAVASATPPAGLLRLLALAAAAYFLGFIIVYICRSGLTDYLDGPSGARREILVWRAALFAGFVWPISLGVVVILNDVIRMCLSAIRKPRHD
jgi:hypothetical protein